MAELTTSCEFEHPSRSLILDPSDKVWKNHFTNGKMEEIKAEMLPPVTELPDEVLDYIDSYEGLHDLEKLYNHYTRFRFHPCKQAALSGAHGCIIRGLKLYFNDYLSKPRTEADLMKHVWCLINYCYDGSIIDVSTQNYRYIQQQTLLETGVKFPKTLKDMFMELVEHAPSKIRVIQTNAFMISGNNPSSLRMSHMIVDSPAGLVCRVIKLPKWLEYPRCAERFTNQIKPILQVVWNAKTSMEQVDRTVGMDTGVQSIAYGVEHSPVLPHFFNPTPATNNCKKRKRSTLDETQYV
ncbi:hypothetical protein DFQ28_002973 [Apophysomyces sp. BC1034]|nr:hypothetical protein DFQ29_000004 [Apophysomyces sp. BC1021]KAG0183640.1 hypothetical protein DFQ29_000065 [Apophysomyces sp. BC1021]KAG0194898.1 hypothetical protein DFQ28_002973 [Apophysomyces sp. BC1034]